MESVASNKVCVGPSQQYQPSVGFIFSSLIGLSKMDAQGPSGRSEDESFNLLLYITFIRAYAWSFGASPALGSAAGGLQIDYGLNH